MSRRGDIWPDLPERTFVAVTWRPPKHLGGRWWAYSDIEAPTLDELKAKLAGLPPERQVLRVFVRKKKEVTA